MSYPRVLSEQETLDRVCAGASLSRFGDGELKMARLGVGIKSQVADRRLSDRLIAILREPHACVVGIPNLHAPGPKHDRWRRFESYSDILGARVYGSSFVSRPDSAPWIDTDAYWAQMASLWRGRAVTLVRGSEKSLTRRLLEADGAGEVREVVAPALNAWASYRELLAAIGTPSRALLCLGPTATVLAADLCAKGVHAIDLGHAGMFWRRRQEAA